MSSGSLKQFLKKTKKNHKTMNVKVSVGRSPARSAAMATRFTSIFTNGIMGYVTLVAQCRHTATVFLFSWPPPA